LSARFLGPEAGLRVERPFSPIIGNQCAIGESVARAPAQGRVAISGGVVPRAGRSRIARHL